MNKIFDKFNSLNLYKKIFYVNIFIMFVFVCVLVVIQYAFINKYVVGQHAYAIRNNHNQATKQIEQNVEKYSETLALIENNETITDFIINGSGYKTPDLDLEEYKRQMDFEKSIQEILSPLDIKTYGIYTSDGYIYTDQGLCEFSKTEMNKTKWYAVIKENFGRVFFCDSSYFEQIEAVDQEYIYCIKPVKGESINEYVGAIRLGISKDLLKEIMLSCCITEDCSVAIFNNNGEIIISCGDKSPGLVEGNADFLSTIPKSESIILEDSTDKNEYLTVKTSIGLTNWEMCVFLPVKKSLESYTALTWKIFLVVAVLFVLVMFIVRKIYMSYTKRLNVFMNTMRLYKKGELCVLDVGNVYDDIGQCIDAYNLMVSNISSMLKEQIKTKEKLHEYDLKILHERVNPHFLYNTLEIINSIAIDKSIDSISETVQKLADYYRLSLNNIRDTLTIEQEIEHSRLYLDIANMRFSKNIEFCCEIPDEMLDMEILKMLLQPVIENSIRHGFMEKVSEEDNEIVVAAYCRGDYVDIEITDNGVGMDNETLERLNNMKIEEDVDEIGLRSTNERIKLFYGEDCGITVKSKQGEYTTVVLRIREKGKN